MCCQNSGYLVALPPLDNFSVVLVTSKVHTSIVKFRCIISWGKIHLVPAFTMNYIAQSGRMNLAGGQNDICSHQVFTSILCSHNTRLDNGHNYWPKIFRGESRFIEAAAPAEGGWWQTQAYPPFPHRELSPRPSRPPLDLELPWIHRIWLFLFGKIVISQCHYSWWLMTGWGYRKLKLVEVITRISQNVQMFMEFLVVNNKQADLSGLCSVCFPKMGWVCDWWVLRGITISCEMQLRLHSGYTKAWTQERFQRATAQHGVHCAMCMMNWWRVSPDKLSLKGTQTQCQY